jgi:hypothetical protein
MDSSKARNFRRLAEARGNRLLRDIQLIGNLANKNNYTYTDADVRKIFSVVDEELRFTKAKFSVNERKIKLD